MSVKLGKFRWFIAGVVGLVVVALVLLVGFRKTVTLTVNGSSQQITTYALRVDDLLYTQGIALSPQDQLSPALGTWLKNSQAIDLVRAIPIQVFADGSLVTIISPQRTPSKLLQDAGVTFKAGDLLLSNGKPVELSQSLPLDAESISLQVVRQNSFTLVEAGTSQNITSTAPTLGSALWSVIDPLFAADQLTPSVSSPVAGVSSASLVRSDQVTIQTGSGVVSFRTSASTVGQALLAAHLAPQGLDYSLPTFTEPVPATHKIRLTHVTEQVLIEQTPIPFETEFQAAPDLDLDSQALIQPGEYGLSAERVRVRYEDGQEASRQTDSQWIAQEPQARIIGYGTNVVMHTTTVDGTTIQYWRAITMYATSYHPSEVGDTTASGLPLKKGVVAVDTSLIPFYTELYIPGYGKAVAADIGGGVHGRMIDLGYSDDDYVGWHSNVTVYFLWPPPANIVWVMP
jgi:uncharacterized protein YabE (DUF348 family)